jgi:glycosyltransferase involved in cell wall biosynthesis
MGFLFIEPWDFTRPLYGDGCSAIADSAIRNLGTKLKLVGVTSDGGIGRWTKVARDGLEFDFLPVIHVERVARPRFLSSNVQFTIALAKHLPAVREAQVRAVLTRTYSVLWLLTYFSRGWDICFYYPGLANPLVVGKHPRLGRLLAALYERIHAGAIGRATIAFAPASRALVEQYNGRLRRLGVNKQVRYLPTAVDLETFCPRPMDQCRTHLGLPGNALVFTFVGRLAAVKGIPLLLEALRCVHDQDPSALLLLVGDGEQYEELQRLVGDKGLGERVRFLGRCPPARVALAIGSANACVVGSFQEGFSVAMVEQIACGRPIVSTAVSGADELIIEGQNGYVVKSRDPAEFARRMLAAAKLAEAGRVSRGLAETRYSERKLWQQIAAEWPPLQ